MKLQLEKILKLIKITTLVVNFEILFTHELDTEINELLSAINCEIGIQPFKAAESNERCVEVSARLSKYTNNIQTEYCLEMNVSDIKIVTNKKRKPVKVNLS